MDALLAQLSHQSVVKHFDAYADVPWDDPQFRIDPADPRWELWPEVSTLGATAWYRALPQPTRARIGLHTIVSHTRIGFEFENVLSRGLLEFAFQQPNGSPLLRYAYHEVIEESQHSLMFQEFVKRSGLPVPGLTGLLGFLGRRVAGLGRTFPELFFVFVLGGEDPIDHVQRAVIHGRPDVHPLSRRIMQIHITEEARHLAFAREYLRHRVPLLSARRRALLAAMAPVVLGVMARLMLQPPAHIIRAYAIPDAVVAEAFTDNPRHRAHTAAALHKVTALCRELGIVRPALWKAFGIWSAV